jgi:hypothetical protein
VPGVKRDPTPPGPVAELFDHLDDLHAKAGRPSMREMAIRAGRGKVSSSTVHNVFRSSRVPRWNFLEAIVVALRGDREEFLELWQAAWAAQQQSEQQSKSSPRVATSRDQWDQPETDFQFTEASPGRLLLRIYIPSERLYAAEARRILSLFRDWLITVRRRRVRQSGYSTARGEVYEFFAEDAAERPEAEPDVQEEFDSFSGFLWLCSKEPAAANELLTTAGVGRSSSTELVSKFGKEARRLQIDLRHERERRILTLRHSLEAELTDNGVDLADAPSNQISNLLDRFVPGASAPESLNILAVHAISRAAGEVTVNINPQIISAMESTIIQNIHGVVNLGPQAGDLLELINGFGGPEARALESAVYELEDTDAPSEARLAAKRRLKKFLGELAGTVRDVGIDLLQTYIEKKAGL